jgi:hypothetical protein
MSEASDVERAHGLGRRRARIFAFQAILFISWRCSSPARPGIRFGRPATSSI